MDGTLEGKVCAVTGATSGIGLETALGLARRGASVAVVGRDEAKGRAALEAVRAASTAGAPALFLADLASMAQVRRLAANLARDLPRLDVLVDNAGAMHAARKLTVDGFEMTLAVNHLAPFLLTNLLLPKLREAGKARVVVVASEAHRMAGLDLSDLMNERSYAGMRVYGQSKLANVMFAYALARRLHGTGVTANALHPGVIATGFGRNDPGWFKVLVTLARPFLGSARRGATTSIWLASSPEVDGVSGRYFSNRREARSSPASLDEAAQELLWAESARLVGLDGQR